MDRRGDILRSGRGVDGSRIATTSGAGGEAKGRTLDLGKGPGSQAEERNQSLKMHGEDEDGQGGVRTSVMDKNKVRWPGGTRARSEEAIVDVLYQNPAPVRGLLFSSTLSHRPAGSSRGPIHCGLTCRTLYCRVQGRREDSLGGRTVDGRRRLEPRCFSCGRHTRDQRIQCRCRDLRKGVQCRSSPTSRRATAEHCFHMQRSCCTWPGFQMNCHTPAIAPSNLTCRPNSEVRCRGVSLGGAPQVRSTLSELSEVTRLGAWL